MDSTGDTPETPTPRTGDRRRWWWLGGAAALVAVVVVVAVVALTGSSDDPADRFDDAAETFHTTYDPLVDQLSSAMGQFGDGAQNAAVTATNEIVDAFDAYDKAVEAIPFPDNAKDAASELRDGIAAGRLVFVNVGASFSLDEMENLLDRFKSSVQNALYEREQALRKVLGS